MIPLPRAARAVLLLLALVFYPAPAYPQVAIRVLVMDDLARLKIDFPPGYQVEDRTGMGVLTRDTGGGASLVIDKDDPAMKGVRMLSRDNPVRINEYALTGVIEIKRNEKGLFRVINEIDLEDYTRAVVGEEMPGDWPMEALKAQAVVARTYALYVKLNCPGGDYDLRSTVESQAFDGAAKVKSRPVLAAMETEGEVVTYDGGPAETLYHSTCGGKTEDPANVWGWSRPYLKPRDCQCVKESPYALWRRVITAGRIDDALTAGGYALKGVSSISIAQRSAEGRVMALDIGADSGDITLKGSDFRRIVGYSRLPSTMFDVKRDGDSFVFVGRGSGHGVGLCQWGAKVMAEGGKGYKEILMYYYPGTTVTKDPSREGGR